MAAASTPLISLEVVAFDTETTGLDARSARLVQIGAVRMHWAEMPAGQRFETLVDPGLPVPPAATAVHGITDAMLRGAPRFAAIEPDLAAFLGEAVLVGHTLSFDLDILRRECGLAGRPFRPYRVLDLRWLARVAAPTLAAYDLDALCAWLSVPVERRHTAIGDALAAGRVYAALIPRLRARGIRTLAEAEAASRRFAEQDARDAGGLIALAAPAAEAPAALARIDSYPYRHRVRDVMSAPPLTAAPDDTVAATLRLVDERRVSSVFVRDADGVWGIVTERDLLRILAREGAAGFAATLDRVLTKPLRTVAEDAFVYRAIGRLNRLGFRHLGVCDAAGEIVGAVTPRDLLRQRAMAAIVLGDAIDSAASVAELGRAWGQLAPMAGALIAEEVDARAVAAIISAEICALTATAARLAEDEMRAKGEGGPPTRYCVLVLGSAGRGESLLAADQDNAVVFAEGEPGGAADRWFEAMAIRMTDILDAVGVPLCKGGVMARNAPWRHSVAGWKALIGQWVRRQKPEDLLNVDIFFDGVAVHGDVALGEEIWNHAWTLGHASADFVKMLSINTPDGGSPFTFLGALRTDETGRIDLKKAGLMPIFSAARVLAIRHDLRRRATPDRLRGVSAMGVGAPEDVERLLDAHETILGVMLAQQIADAGAGVPLSSKVRVAGLDRADRERLRAALKQVPLAAALVAEGRF